MKLRLINQSLPSGEGDEDFRCDVCGALSDGVSVGDDGKARCDRCEIRYLTDKIEKAKREGNFYEADACEEILCELEDYESEKVRSDVREVKKVGDGKRVFVTMELWKPADVCQVEGCWDEGVKYSLISVDGFRVSWVLCGYHLRCFKASDFIEENKNVV